jgi:hypothetical protein
MVQDTEDWVLPILVGAVGVLVVVVLPPQPSALAVMVEVA